MTSNSEVSLQLHTDRRREQADEDLRAQAEEFADRACELADSTARWTPPAVEEALAAVDIVAEALGQLGPAAVAALAPVTAGTAEMRRLVQEAALPRPASSRPAVNGVPVARSPRRGLGPGWRGIRTPGRPPPL
ncbi:hypothetical protein [Streptomyces zhaozhouensis]|uniref:hypothetical protein n=1 Tax=Streptomyces zhaozhouensis TaxID=1300267 RepID=UPI000BE3180A|nr:hypothetical protein [Streptomyces zhaozhouensis]